jgi:hypothetical protein
VEKLVVLINNKLYLKSTNFIDGEFYQNIINRIYAYEELLIDANLIDEKRRITSLCDGDAFLTNSTCFDGNYLKRLISTIAKYECLLEQNRLIEFKRK